MPPCLPCQCHSAPSYTVPRHRLRCSTGHGLPLKAAQTRPPSFISSCFALVLLQAGGEVGHGCWPMLRPAWEGHLAFAEGKSRGRARRAAANPGTSLLVRRLPTGHQPRRWWQCQLWAAGVGGRGSLLGSSKPSRLLTDTRLKGNHPGYPFSCLWEVDTSLSGVTSHAPAGLSETSKTR